MANISASQRRSIDLFTKPRATRRRAFAERAEAPVAMTAPAAGGRPLVRRKSKSFSAFDPDDIIRASTVLDEAIRSLKEEPDPEAGLARAMDVLEKAKQEDKPGLAEHALGSLSVHASTIREDAVPTFVPPEHFRLETADEEEAPEPSDLVDPAAAGEALLHWFREDLYLNEHHRHWHFVFSTAGILRDEVYKLKDRQGEVFVYMHQQMNARYETERLTAGLAPVDPLIDAGTGEVSKPLGAGYDPNEREPKDVGYVARPDNEELDDAAIEDLSNRARAFLQFVSDFSLFCRVGKSQIFRTFGSLMNLCCPSRKVLQCFLNLMQFKCIFLSSQN